jgi:type II secretory pathway pseudopilin PulG
MSRNRIQPVARQSGLCRTGFTLAELLIALGLLGVMIMPLYMTLGKSRAQVVQSAADRQLTYEINKVVEHLTDTLKNTAYVDSTAFDKKLILSVYDPTTQTTEAMAWGINSVSSVNRLQLSSDGGSTWRSPFPVSPFSAYAMAAGDILYCGATNNCTQFQDTNGNGTYGVGDTATLASGYSGTALTSPRLARKIVLRGWSIARSGAFNSMAFTLPDLFINLPQYPYNPGTVGSGSAVNSIATNSGSFPASGFTVADVAFDSVARVLWVVGKSDKVYRINDDGVLIGPVITVSGVTTPSLLSVAPVPDSSTVWLLNDTNYKLYRISATSSASAATATELTYTGLTTATAVVYDPGNSSSIFLVGDNSGTKRIVQYNSSTGATENTWTLPVGLTDPVGASIDPISGDFLIWNKTVSSNTITLYRIQLGTAPAVTSSTSTYLLTALGSATTTGVYFGLGNDIAHNRLYITDQTDQKIYIVSPKTQMTRTL